MLYITMFDVPDLYLNPQDQAANPKGWYTMAAYQKLGSRWRAIVRNKGCSAQNKSSTIQGAATFAINNEMG